MRSPKFGNSQLELLELHQFHGSEEFRSFKVPVEHDGGGSF